MRTLFVSTQIVWSRDERQKRRARKTQSSISGSDENERANWSSHDLSSICKPRSWTSFVIEATLTPTSMCLNSFDCALMESFLPRRHQTAFDKTAVIQSSSVFWKMPGRTSESKRLRARHICGVFWTFNYHCVTMMFLTPRSYCLTGRIFSCNFFSSLRNTRKLITLTIRSHGLHTKGDVMTHAVR